MKPFKDIPERTEFRLDGKLCHKIPEFETIGDCALNSGKIYNAYCITTRELVFIQGNEEVEVIEEGKGVES